MFQRYDWWCAWLDFDRSLSWSSPSKVWKRKNGVAITIGNVQIKFREGMIQRTQSYSKKSILLTYEEVLVIVEFGFWTRSLLNSAHFMNKWIEKIGKFMKLQFKIQKTKWSHRKQSSIEIGGTHVHALHGSVKVYFLSLCKWSLIYLLMMLSLLQMEL